MYSPDEHRDAHGHWTTGGAVGQIVKSLGGLRDEQARGALGAGHALDTQKLHTGEKGAYTPPRAELHKQILTHFLSQGQSRPAGTKPEAIFTAGGPASGKASLAGRNERNPAMNLPVPRGHVYVNPDDIKSMLPEYHALKAAGRHDVAASAVHEESSHLAKVLTSEAMKRRMPLVVDGVGDSGKGKFAGKLRAADKAGYRVTTRYAHLPVHTALQREDARFQRTGRKVGSGLLESAHQQVAARYNGEIKNMRNIRVEVHSTAGAGKPSLIAVKDPQKGEGMHVINRPAYNEFVSKSKTPTASRLAA